MSKQCGLRALNGVMSKLRREQGRWSLSWASEFPRSPQCFPWEPLPNPWGEVGDSGRSLVHVPGWWGRERDTPAPRWALTRGCTWISFSCGMFSEDPFASLEAPVGKGAALHSFQRTMWRENPSGAVVVLAGGLWVVLVLSNVSSVFNVAGVSVSARNLL